MVSGVSSEIRDELQEVLNSNRLVCLESLQLNEGGVQEASLLGTPDPSIRDTLDALQREGNASAGQLSEMNPRVPPITVNGWNNRLADLHRFRLAQRVKQGRQWVYASVGKVVRHG